MFEVVDFLFFITTSDGGVGIEAYFHEMSVDGVGAKTDDEIIIISFCSHRYIVWEIYIYIYILCC